MLNKLINLSDIRTFVLIARLGNFSKAAEKLAVSRSHVSRQLSQLEEVLGVTLIKRTTRTQQLTEAGKALLVECEIALNRIEQATQETIKGNTKLRGHLRINCVGGYLGENIIAPLIAQFITQYPEISIDLDFSSHHVNLLAEQFDVVFRMGNIPDGDFIAKPLADIEIITLASPGYLKQYGTPKHPKELAEQPHRCIVGSVSTWHYNSASGQNIDIKVNPILTCKNGQVMVQSARLHLGIIRVPKQYCQADIEQGNLIHILQDWRIPTVPFSLLYHQDKFRPKRIRTFIDFIEGQFRDNLMS